MEENISTNGMTTNEILSKLPYSAPFLFVDELIEVTENSAKGSYTFSSDLDFYKGHFKNNPITPGVILIETMAQIGVVCLGIYLIEKKEEEVAYSIAFTASKIEFLKPVYPNEKVMVYSEKIYYRFGKLKCKVEMINSKEEVTCCGEIEGMLISKKGE